MVCTAQKSSPGAVLPIWQHSIMRRRAYMNYSTQPKTTNFPNIWEYVLIPKWLNTSLFKLCAITSFLEIKNEAWSLSSFCIIPCVDHEQILIEELLYPVDSK